MRWFKILTIVLAIFAATAAFGQNNATNASKQSSVAAKVDSTPVKSSLSYEKLTQFFQTTVTTGNNGGFDFKASWFGIKQLFARDTDKLKLSRYYSANKFSRNFEVSMGMNKDKSGDLSTIVAGIKYSPINKRSKADVNFYGDPKVKAAIVKIHDILNSAAVIYQKKVLSQIKDPTQLQAKIKTLQDSIKKFNADKTPNYDDLPGDLKPILDSILKADYKNESMDYFTKQTKKFTDSLAKRIDTRSLLTLSLNPGYNYTHKYFDTTSFTISYVVGFGKNINKPLNIDLSVQGILAHDTLGGAQNLSREMVISKAGISKILEVDDKLDPIIEVEAQGEDDYIGSAVLYKNEQKNKFTANAILTFHLTKTVSLPITIKYNIKNPNVFGIFGLQWNMESSK